MRLDVDRTERAHEAIMLTFMVQITFILFREETMCIVLILLMRVNRVQFGGKNACFIKTGSSLLSRRSSQRRIATE
jgi:hypothetical protein